MNILHVFAPGPIAGAEKSVLGALAALKEAKQETLLVILAETRSPEHGDQFSRLARAHGIATKELRCRGRLDLRLIHELGAVLKQGAFDIVHAHCYKALFYLSTLRASVQALVASYHGATAHTSQVRLYEWLEWVLFQNVDSVFAVSAGAQKAIELRGAMRSRIAIIPNMLSEKFELPESPPLPKKDGLPMELLYLGRLSVEKGPDVLLQSLTLLGKSVPYRLTILGDGPLRSTLEQQVEKAGLQDTVRFLGFKSSIQADLMAADVLVMPSRTEGLPMALIEATAAGKPVVATRVGGIPEIIEDGVTGLLAAPDNPEELADRLEKMFGDLHDYQSRCHAKAQEIQDGYSPERWAGQALREYERIRKGE
ncbi:MAG: glycosyltransferase [Deltaproteobacteria bacterium]|nr:glycosyltransferase [Deltaproteobacteria bacterium]